MAAASASSRPTTLGRPTPRECLLMSNLTYSDHLQTYYPSEIRDAYQEGGTKAADKDDDIPQYQADAAELQRAGWQVLKQIRPGQSAESPGYAGTIFVNNSRGQVVVAHRGTQNFDSIITDLQAVVMGVETLQEQAAAKLSQDAVAYAKASGFHLTQTGHSLGGFLGQVCLVNHHKPDSPGTTMHYGDVSAITFDNPGSSAAIARLQSHLEGLKPELFDSISILSWPNAVNTCNAQIGTILFLTPQLAPGATRGSYYQYSFNKAHPLTTLRTVFQEGGYPLRDCCHLMADWPVADHTNITSATSGISTALYRSLFGDSGRLTGTLEGSEVKITFAGIDPRDPGSVIATAAMSFSQKYNLSRSGHFHVDARNPYQILNMRHMHPRARNFLLNYLRYSDLKAHLEMSREVSTLLSQCSIEILMEVPYLTLREGNVYEIVAQLEAAVLAHNLDQQIQKMIDDTPALARSLAERLNTSAATPADRAMSYFGHGVVVATDGAPAILTMHSGVPAGTVADPTSVAMHQAAAQAAAHGPVMSLSSAAIAVGGGPAIGTLNSSDPDRDLNAAVDVALRYQQLRAQAPVVPPSTTTPITQAFLAGAATPSRPTSAAEGAPAAAKK